MRGGERVEGCRGSVRECEWRDGGESGTTICIILITVRSTCILFDKF